MSRQFASAGDLTEKTISFTEIGAGLYAFTAEGDPNSGVIVGDDSVMIIEAQATPRLAEKVIEKVEGGDRQADQPSGADALPRRPGPRCLRLQGADGDHEREGARHGG